MKKSKTKVTIKNYLDMDEECIYVFNCPYCDDTVDVIFKEEAEPCDGFTFCPSCGSEFQWEILDNNRTNIMLQCHCGGFNFQADNGFNGYVFTCCDCGCKFDTESAGKNLMEVLSHD